MAGTVSNGAIPSARLIPAAFTATSSEQQVPWQVPSGNRLAYARGGDWRINDGSTLVYVPVPGWWLLCFGLAVSSSQAAGTTIRGILDVAGTTVTAASAVLRATSAVQIGCNADTGVGIYIEPGEPIHLRAVLLGGSTAPITVPSYLGLELKEGV